jgi:hypothetical protein
MVWLTVDGFRHLDDKLHDALDVVRLQGHTLMFLFFFNYDKVRETT